jgi:hypothetical protein
MYQDLKKINPDIIFITLRTILNWICVCKEVGKGMVLPGDPLFSLYRHFETLIGCFDDMKDPEVMDAVRSFIQMKHTHTITEECVGELDFFFEQNPTFCNVFNEVYEMISMIKLTSNGAQTHVIRVCFQSPEGTIPGHAWFYAMLLHPSLPSYLRKMVFLHVRNVSSFRTPSRFKGHRWVIQAPPNVDTPHTLSPLVTLMSHLEYNAFADPVKKEGIPPYTSTADWITSTQPYHSSWFVRQNPVCLQGDLLELQLHFYNIYTSQPLL